MKFLGRFFSQILSQILRLIRKFRQGKFSKRMELVLVTVVLTGGLIATQLASFEDRGKMVLALSFLTFVLSAWALRENLKGVKWLTLLILPPLFSGAVGLFYFLLPVRWLTRLPIAGLYALGMYALLLTENIYGIATERTIGLLRAAQSVGLLLSLIIYFLIVETIVSFRLSFILNFIFIFIFSYLLVLPSLWSVRLGETVKKENSYSLVIALCLAELAFVFSFWPVDLTIEALFLTTIFYVLVGLSQRYLVRRLFKNAIKEFSLVFLAVFLLLILTTSWR